MPFITALHVVFKSGCCPSFIPRWYHNAWGAIATRFLSKKYWYEYALCWLLLQAYAAFEMRMSKHSPTLRSWVRTFRPLNHAYGGAAYTGSKRWKTSAEVSWGDKLPGLCCEWQARPLYAWAPRTLSGLWSVRYEDRLPSEGRMFSISKTCFSLSIDILIHNWTSNNYVPLDILNIYIFSFGTPGNDCI